MALPTSGGVNEDNIDLNRNCLDFAAGVPTNTDYEDLHPVLAPEDYGLRPAHWDAQVGEWIKARGFPAFQAAVSSGQYTRPDGLFYGGFGTVLVCQDIPPDCQGGGRQRP